MKNISNTLGFIASVTALAAFIAYTVCFAAITVANPPFAWTNFADFVAYSSKYSQNFKYIAMGFMILYSVCFILQIVCIREKTDEKGRFFAGIAAQFATGFAVLIGINYFVQLGAVRLQMAAGRTAGLEQFVQANPISVLSAVNMLGWTVFFGLACLFASLCFGGGRVESTIRYALSANAVMMLCCAVAFVFNVTLVLALFMFLGMGAAVITATVPLCLYFRR